jgi:hypothetical protein
MGIMDASPLDHMMRRLNSSLYTLYNVANIIDEFEGILDEDSDERADLLILAENLIDVTTYITLTARRIAWMDELVEADQDDDTDF